MSKHSGDAASGPAATRCMAASPPTPTAMEAAPDATRSLGNTAPSIRGSHLLTPELNLRTFGNTSLLELNFSTCGPHPWVILGYVGDTVSLC
jgi:hypothetical protein